MRKFQIIFILFLIIQINICLASATEFNDNLVIDRELNISNGLPHNGVSCMMRDSRDYLWIGTYDGLAKYNSFSITTYKNTLDTKLFQSNRIRTLAEDCNKSIWIGNDNGVTIYDYNTNKFIQLAPKLTAIDKSIMTVRKIVMTSDKKRAICITENNGFFIYDLNGKLIKHIIVPNYYTFCDAIEINNGIILLAGNKGLCTFDANKYVFSPILKGKIEDSNSVIRTGNNTILVAGINGENEVTYHENKNIISYTVTNNKQFNTNSIKVLGLRNNKQILSGSLTDGFYLSTPEGKRITHQLSGYRISAFINWNNYIWVSTFDNGVFRFRNRQKAFHEGNIKGVHGPSFISYNNDACLINSGMSDIYLYDTKSHTQSQLPKCITDIHLANKCYIYKDKLGSYWSFDNKGECKRYFNGKIVTFKINIKNIPVATVSTVTEDYNGNIWVSYLNNVIKITPSKQGDIVNCESLLDNPIFKRESVRKIRYIYFDSLKNKLWIGTDVKGLYAVNITSNRELKSCRIEHYYTDENNANSLSSNFVSSIIRTSDKTLWIGTEQGGICRVDESTSSLKFHAYSEKDGLSNNVVKSLLCDKKGRLWIATNIGLNLYDKTTNSFHKFGSKDGLPFENFWYHSMLLPDGTLLFSSFTGFCYLKPDSLSLSEELPQIHISRMHINNDVVPINEEFNNRIVLKHQLENNNSIELKYYENSFTFDVDAIYDDNSDNHYISYFLENSSHEWITIQASKQNISFNGLQPGKYKLRIKASNAFGKWTNEYTLSIVVNPPIWQTIYAYIFYVLILICVIVAVIKVLLRIQALQHKLHVEEINKRNLEIMNIEKQRFFANISHELKTPLSLIFAPIDMLSKHFSLDINVTEKLNIIKRQSKKMLKLINMAHDMEKSNEGLLKPNMAQFSLYQFFEEQIEDYKFMAKYENKQLTINHPEKELFVTADYSMFEKILNNILTNAFKHTKENDSITIKYYTDNQENNSIIIEISDTGYGISEKDLPLIFEQYYQSENQKYNKVGGTGIGLTLCKIMVELHKGNINVQSTKGKGTTFTLSLPIKEKEAEYNKVNIAKRNDEVIINNDNNNIINEQKLCDNDSMIFIVEDNAEVRSLLCDIVGKYYHVKSFVNGQDCLDRLNEEWPNLILSDVMMPGVNGIELCNSVKSDIKTSHIPIILLTACTTVDETIEGINSGADAYINKPFYPELVLTRINMLLLSRKQLRERYQIGIPLSNNNQSKSISKDNEFLEQLYSLFNDNLSNEEVDIDSFASVIGINRSLFFQKIKALTNTTPYELLKKYRLKKAAELLEKGELSVGEVSYMTGFKSRTHFGRLFKTEFGITPGKYAEMVSNKTVSELISTKNI